MKNILYFVFVFFLVVQHCGWSLKVMILYIMRSVSVFICFECVSVSGTDLHSEACEERLTECNGKIMTPNNLNDELQLIL